MVIVIGAGLAAEAIVQTLRASGIEVRQLAVRARRLLARSPTEQRILDINVLHRGFAARWHGVLSLPAVASASAANVAREVVDDWHGSAVADAVLEGGSFVPLAPRRPRTGPLLVLDSLTGVDIDGTRVRLTGQSQGAPTSLAASQIIVAAGSLGTYEALMSLGLSTCDADFDDRCGAAFGVVRASDVPSNRIERFWNGHAKWYFRTTCGQMPISYTVRPTGADQNGDGDPLGTFDLYARSQASIVAKMIRTGSSARIAEAMFNKFGLAIPSQRVALVGHIYRERALSIRDGVLAFDSTVRPVPAARAEPLRVPQIVAPGFHFTNMRLATTLPPSVGSLFNMAEQGRPILLASAGQITEPFVEHTTLYLLARAIDGARHLAEAMGRH